MENHPIPQDVTGFQFKLIGNMTVKQFAYVAVGCVMAVIFYYSPIFILIKLLFIPTFIISGLALAFVPIEGRPIDVMAGNFLKALFAPNQFIYQKTGVKLAFFAIHFGHPAPQKTPAEKDKKKHEEQKEHEVQTMLQPKSHAPHTALDDKEQDFLTSLVKESVQKQHGPAFITIEEDPNAEQRVPKIETIADETKNPIVHYTAKESVAPDAPVAPKSPQPVQQPTQQIAQPAINPLQVQAEAKQKVAELGTQLQQVATEKAQLQSELTTLKKTLTQDPKQVFSPTTAVPQVATQHVRRIPQMMAKQVGLPNIPDAPNLVTGIVKDSGGNILPGILVEVKDKEGNPIRAFKTNGLGQFASATSLPNGTYTIEFEDPREKHRFDVIEIATTGAIIMPIEVLSHDERESLRKELFGG